MRIPTLRTRAATGLLAILSASGVSTEAWAGAYRGVAADPSARPVPVVVIAAYPILIRPSAYPPCRLGSNRWYGPYGYICYRPQPGPFGLPGPLSGR